MYGNTGAGDDLDDEEVVEEEVDNDKPMLNLVASPSPIERVTQLALGGEHGLLLTDAGKVYTFGDNRYGQLGRTTCAKVESRIPYIVPDMVKYEAKMVAAGVHHNLVLVAPGLVWSWGRNKGGQLGCGDLKDKCLPVPVERLDVETPHRLGRADDDIKEDREGWLIVVIGAGLFSSLAAAYNSDVWQWGQLSDSFKVRVKQKARFGQPVKYQEMEKRITGNRPVKVFERTSFKAPKERQKIPSAQLGCRAVGVFKNKKEFGDRAARIKELTDAAVQLQQSIQSDRVKLDLNVKKGAVQTTKGAVKEESPQDLLIELTDTINKMERDLINIKREISQQEKKLTSCDLQQEHNQKQIHILEIQAARLSEDLDKVSVSVLNCPQKSPERKKLEEREEEIKRFMESNKITKMALLDQRGDTDKEKQSITQELKKQGEHWDGITKRLTLMRSMLGAVNSASGMKDGLVRFLKDRMDDFRHHFDDRPQADDAASFLQDYEADTKFLAATEAKLQEQGKAVHDSEVAKKARLEKISALLVDIIELRRNWNDMLRETWKEEELDVEAFFLGRNAPQKRGLLMSPRR